MASPLQYCACVSEAIERAELGVAARAAVEDLAAAYNLNEHEVELAVDEVLSVLKYDGSDRLVDT